MANFSAAWKLFRFLRISVGTNLAVAGGFIGLAARGEDDTLRQLERNGRALEMHASTFSSFPTWESVRRRWLDRTTAVAAHTVGSHPSTTLSPEELYAMQCIVSLLAFDLRPEVFAVMAPNVEISDPLVYLKGVSEVKDAFLFLSKFFTTSEPVIDSLIRTATGQLLVTTETTAVTPLWYKPIVFRSTIACDVGVIPTGPAAGAMRLKRIEHHWFNGQIAGRDSFGRPWCDLGELARRWNGFVLSLFTTWTADHKGL